MEVLSEIEASWEKCTNFFPFQKRLLDSGISPSLDVALTLKETFWGKKTWSHLFPLPFADEQSLKVFLIRWGDKRST